MYLRNVKTDEEKTFYEDKLSLWVLMEWEFESRHTGKLQELSKRSLARLLFQLADNAFTDILITDNYFRYVPITYTDQIPSGF